jgi:Rho-type GTPase-activating protein 1/2
MYHEECFRCQECTQPISGTVYASTSKGVFCVNCHNERMARSRRHHEERKRRAKERAERKARERAERGDSDRTERGGISPGLNVDRDKSLPAPPPSEPEPSPHLSLNSLSPVLPEIIVPADS